MRRASGGFSAGIVVLAILVLAAPAPAAAPAHGRVWELVTTGPTNGVKLVGTSAWSADGDRVGYGSVGPMPGSPSGDLLASAVATRTAGGWTKQPLGEPITIAAPELLASIPLAASADLTSWIWYSTQPLLPAAPAAPEVGLYRRGPDSALTLLGPVDSPASFIFVAASDDATHVVFQSTAHLLPGDAERFSGADAYEFAGDTFRMVGVDSAGSALSLCGAAVGSGTDAPTDALTHAVSRDGQRIFLTSPSDADCSVPKRVYLRDRGAETTDVSASRCTRPDCDAPQDVTFAGATPDGSHAFLVTAQQLTNDDTDESPDLYRYDVADGSLTRLSAGPPGVEAGVSAPVRSSDDGQLVYFIATGQLVPGHGTPGEPSLYLSDRGTLRYVAPAADVNLRAAGISASGRVLAFSTAASLLPTDTDTNVDVYRYDAGGDTLALISNGTGGSGNGAFDVTFGAAGSVPVLQAEGMRYMSADGSRIAFTTSEALVPGDVNATPDVYEWADGDLGLVSSGAGDASVTYGGMSADGRSVFFSTDESLVPGDRNNGDQDLYDARLGGGFPAAPPPPPPCEEDACQGVPGPRLAWPAPATETFAASPEPPPVGRLRILRLDRDAGRRLGQGARTTVVVDVPDAGAVSLRVYARLHGRATVVARADATARTAGAVRMHVRLSTAARRTLRRNGHLRLTLTARVSHRPAATLRVDLAQTR